MVLFIFVSITKIHLKKIHFPQFHIFTPPYYTFYIHLLFCIKPISILNLNLYLNWIILGKFALISNKILLQITCTCTVDSWLVRGLQSIFSWNPEDLAVSDTKSTNLDVTFFWNLEEWPIPYCQQKLENTCRCRLYNVTILMSNC